MPLVVVVVVVLLAVMTLSVDAFAPPQPSFMARTTTVSSSSKTRVYGFMPEPEREKLTRDSEPEDFFATWVISIFVVFMAWCIWISASQDEKGIVSLSTALVCFLTPLFLLYLCSDNICSNTDKMSDEEKLPIAIAGVAFITLPFIAGLIALYSAK
jgi:hypothetical protein